MEYIYAAMLLHKAGQEINEANLKKVLEAANVKAEDGRIKALLASLEGVNIDEVVEKAAAAPVAVAAAPAAESSKEEKKEEKKKDEGKKQEEAAAGLGALFG